MDVLYLNQSLSYLALTMKKVFSGLIFMISIQAFSQISLGLTGGFLLSTNKYTDSLPSPNKGNKLGIETLVRLNKKWKLRTGLEYVSFNFALIQPGHLPTRDNVQYYHSKYINIPIGFQYTFFVNNKLKPFIDCSMNFMTNVDHQTSITNNTKNIILTNPKPQSFIVSPTIGIGVLFNPAEKIYTSFMIHYSYQINSMYTMPNNKSEEKQLRYNSINTSLSIGYCF
jgi:hypothetical protein